ncbi:class I SAM-dependent methyltransferase [Nocardioides sp.]|uniref:class I SAM-dependent methyltransferase n=1 Tax=Nocardioides sp. TaxID=35761 RepID=UPI00273325D7|nr:class I SAM-dependent methyltransferase [Nocardioides sp.]MDP3892264.1 class I SAM-dependent methyltransferase [Nocardioides sp.]
MNTTTTTPTDAPDLDALRTRQQQVWSSGDYNRIAAITVPVAETLVIESGVRPGSHVLDVATGTGHAALAAARQGARVAGIDYVPALLDIARSRAAAERLDAEFVEAPAEELPFPDEHFDTTVSAIGVMFAADHTRAASELVRVTKPGGRIALASWTPAGFVGGILGAVGRHVSPPPGAQSPVRWGVEDTVAELLGEQVAAVTSSVHTVTQRFADAEAFADLFLAYYGPTHMAARALGPERRDALRTDLVAHADASARPDSSPGHLVLDWEFRIVTAERRS